MLKNKLLFTTTVITSMFSYGRAAYAACVNSSGATYLCSGSNSSSVVIARDGANVSTAPGFGVNTNSGNAITVSGDGAINFTDNNASTIATSANGIGLYVQSVQDDGGIAGSVTINTNGDIAGGNYGVKAVSLGTGSVSVTTNGTVVGTNKNGIHAHAYSYANGVTVNSQDVTGGEFGIKAINLGLGGITITADDVNGVTDTGIHAYNYPGATSGISITADQVNGGNAGVRALNHNAGGIAINTGDVVGSGDIGVHAHNFGYGGSSEINITTGSVSGATGGIRAIQLRNGTTSITANGDVVGAGGSGIHAHGYGNSQGMVINSNAVQGTLNGIRAISTGNGEVLITAQGDVSGAAGAGIHVHGYGNTDGIEISAQAVEGSTYGIRAVNVGSGDLLITTQGDLVGTTESGIFARAYGSTTNLTVDVKNVSGQKHGIYARSFGTGELTITAQGNISGTNYAGIFARGYGNGTGATITTAAHSSVSGGNFGIYTRNFANESSVITINGDVSSTAGTGLYFEDASLAQVTITNGGTVSGNRGIVAETATRTNILLDGAASAVSVTGTGGTAIELGDSADALQLKGNVGLSGDILGGLGSDILTLDSARVTLSNNSAFTGFENILLSGISYVDGDFSAVGSNVSTTGGELHVNGAFAADNLTVASGSTFAGNNTVTADLIINNGGTLAPGNSVGTINVVGNSTFNSGSTFDVEFDSTGIDNLTATGNIDIQSNANLLITSIGDITGSSGTFLNAGGVLTGAFDNIITNGLGASVDYTANAAALVVVTPGALNAQSLSALQSAWAFTDAVKEQSRIGAFSKENRTWLKGVYSHNDRDADGNFSGFNNNIYGVVGGAEHNVSPNWNVGVSVAQLTNSSDLDNGVGKSNGDGSFAALYGTYNTAYDESVDLYATLSVKVGYHSSDNKRDVINSGVISQARSESDAYEAGTSLQVGTRTKISDGGWFVSPQLGVDYTHLFNDGYSEATGGGAAVSVDDYDYGTLRRSAEVRFYNNEGVTIPNSELKVRPSLNVGVFYEDKTNDRDVNGSFANGDPFNVKLDENSNTFASAGAGLDFDISEGVIGFVNYQHAQSSNETRDDARVGVRMEF